MAEGIEFLSSFNGFIPLGGDSFDRLPPAAKQQRFGEDQLYALALWLYSLNPPPNPKPPDVQLVAAGKKVFEREACGGCHTPPLYTNNKLTPARGFSVPPEHRSKYEVLSIIVGTDSRLTMETRRGTGYLQNPVASWAMVPRAVRA